MRPESRILLVNCPFQRVLVDIGAVLKQRLPITNGMFIEIPLPEWLSGRAAQCIYPKRDGGFESKDEG